VALSDVIFVGRYCPASIQNGLVCSIGIELYLGLLYAVEQGDWATN